MNGYKERKNINIIGLIIVVVVILAIALFVVLFLNNNKKNAKVKKYYGTYEITVDNYNKYGDDITPKKIIDINKENVNVDGLITSSKINFIEFDSVDAILVYFNSIATTTSKEEDRVNELGFIKLCFTKDGDNLKQLDCPNVINDQNLGSSVENAFIEYKKKTN